MHPVSKIDYQQFFKKAAKKNNEWEKVTWGSLKSMYAKFAALFNFISRSFKGKVLDVGCGTGAFIDYASSKMPDVQFYGVDIIEEFIEMCINRKINNARFLYGDINNLPFSDKAFNLVTCIGVLQNFNGNWIKAIKEICRVSNRYLYVVTLDEATEKKNPYDIYYNPEEIRECIEQNDFSVCACYSIATEPPLIRELHETQTFCVFAEREVEKQ